jgi:hypothetical protein
MTTGVAPQLRWTRLVYQTGDEVHPLFGFGATSAGGVESEMLFSSRLTAN